MNKLQLTLLCATLILSACATNSTFVTTRDGVDPILMSKLIDADDKCGGKLEMFSDAKFNYKLYLKADVLNYFECFEKSAPPERQKTVKVNRLLWKGVYEGAITSEKAQRAWDTYIGN